MIKCYQCTTIEVSPKRELTYTVYMLSNQSTYINNIVGQCVVRRLLILAVGFLHIKVLPFSLSFSLSVREKFPQVVSPLSSFLSFLPTWQAASEDQALIIWEASCRQQLFILFFKQQRFIRTWRWLITVIYWGFSTEQGQLIVSSLLIRA